MNAWLTRLLTAALVLGLAPVPAAAAPTVKDEAKLFSDAAKVCRPPPPVRVG